MLRMTATSAPLRLFSWVCVCSHYSICVLDFPHCAVHEMPELTAESLVSETVVTPAQSTIGWRSTNGVALPRVIFVCYCVCFRKQETVTSSVGEIYFLVSICWEYWTSWPSGNTPGQWWVILHRWSFRLRRILMYLSPERYNHTITFDNTKPEYILYLSLEK